MSEIFYNEFDDFPVIKTTTGIVDRCRVIATTGNPMSMFDIPEPMFLERFDYIIEFGYVVPTIEFVNELKVISEPWVSIGCGLGFIESILLKNGVDIIATDISNPIENLYFRRPGYCDIKKMTSYDAINYDRNVFISWPCVDKPWAYECIRSMKSGQKLIYIGEGLNGCTADMAFHVYLGRNFTLLRELPHKKFAGIEDKILLYTKQ